MATAEATKDTAVLDELSLLEKLLQNSRALDDTELEQQKDYLQEFLSHVVTDDQVTRKDAAAEINHWIAKIDEKISTQLNEIMHDPKFQKLEGSWRGLHYLVHQSETGTTLKIRVLNLTKRELLKDLEMVNAWAEGLGAQAPALRTALNAYRELKKKGYSELDTAAIAKLYVS